MIHIGGLIGKVLMISAVRCETSFLSVFRSILSSLSFLHVCKVIFFFYFQHNIRRACESFTRDTVENEGDILCVCVCVMNIYFFKSFIISFKILTISSPSSSYPHNRNQFAIKFM